MLRNAIVQESHRDMSASITPIRATRDAKIAAILDALLPTAAVALVQAPLCLAVLSAVPSVLVMYKNHER